MSLAIKSGLKSDDILKINSIFEKYPEIAKVILYGSRALGNFKPASDIDLTIVSEKMNLSTLLQIDNEIDDLLLPYKVDLSLFSTLDNNNLIDHIQRVGLDFFSR